VALAIEVLGIGSTLQGIADNEMVGVDPRHGVALSICYKIWWCTTLGLPFFGSVALAPTGPLAA
jgi:hypothetical protein